MIVVVTGSRCLVEHPDKLAIKREFIDLIGDFYPDQVFHGNAGGPDAWAAFEFDQIAVPFHPLHTPGRSAAQRLFDRNHRMINTAIKEDSEVRVVACWDGKSRGTRHAMDYAEHMGVPMVETKVRVL